MTRPPGRSSGNAAGKQTDSQKLQQRPQQQERKARRGSSAAPGRVRGSAAPAYGMPGEEWIAAGEFKARCLELMDRVQERHEPIVITKHGVPVAQLIPYDREEKRTFIGSMRGTVLWEGDLISPLDVEWDACADGDPKE